MSKVQELIDYINMGGDYPPNLESMARKAAAEYEQTRAAMQQALAAMLRFPDDISDEMFESIRALKAALAQERAAPAISQADIDAGPHAGITTPADHSDAAPPKALPVQEPVAKCIDDICSEHFGRVEAFDYLPRDTLLYTAPPQRKPLTDEEIEACRQQGYAHPGLNSPFDFGRAARAVERALESKNR